MSQRLAGTYSADRVLITIDGLASIIGAEVPIDLPFGLTIPHAIDGIAADAFLTVAREVPTNSKTTGGDGEVTVNTSLNRSGSFTVTVSQSSLSNIVLSSMLTLWESGVRFFFPLTVVDLESFGTLYEAEQCYIAGWPEAGFGASVGTNVWVIEAPVLRMFHGGRGIV
jgi:hypothetical protein